MPVRTISKHPRPAAAGPPSTASVPPRAADDGNAPQAPDDVDIEQLSAQLGPASDAEVRAIVGDVPAEELIAEGRRVDTQRVSDDGARVLKLAHAFMLSAPPEVLVSLDLTPEVVRVAAWSCAEAQRAWSRMKAQKAQRRGTRQTRTAKNLAQVKAAAVERDRLADSLRKVDPAGASERVDAAVSPAAQGHADAGPGRALASLVDVGRAYLASGDPDVRARCAMWKVTAARLDRCAAVAADSLAAERSENTPFADDFAAAQAEVDRMDGVNLMLLDFVVRAFAQGRKAHASIPALRLVSLRGVLGKHARRAAKPAAPSDPKAPAPAKPAKREPDFPPVL